MEVYICFENEWSIELQDFVGDPVVKVVTANRLDALDWDKSSTTEAVCYHEKHHMGMKVKS